jgi:hypothetical protein
VERAAAAGVPVVEISLAAIPFLGLASAAGIASLVALVAFSAVVVLGRLRIGRRLECGCFGTAATRDYRLLLARNGVLVAVALVAWRRGVDDPVGGSLGVPSGGELVPAALVVLGLGIAAWVGVRALGAGRRGAASR